MLPEGWQIIPLGQIARVERGRFSVRPRNDPRYYGGAHPFVQTGDITQSGVYLTKYSQTLNDAGLSVSKNFPANSILMTIAANIGEVVIATFPVACPDSIVGIVPYPTKADVVWLVHYLEMEKSGLDRKAPKLAQKNINLEVIKPLEIRLPPLPEQKKIADILSTWDAAIVTTGKLLVNAEAQKRALMQQLLTGKRRLKGFEGREWRIAPISSIAHEVSERNKSAGDLPVISCSKTVGFVNSLEYFKKQVFSDDLSSYKVIRRNQIGYPSNHIEEGSIGHQTLHDVALVSPIYTIFETSRTMDAAFLFRVLKTDRYRQVFAAATNGSVDRRGSLRWKAFSLIRVPVPELDEQQAIMSVLETAIREEQLARQSLAHLQTEKRALMQQLLTGKRTVKI
jgi:type I restriction enzyme S subunit